MANNINQQVQFSTTAQQKRLPIRVTSIIGTLHAKRSSRGSRMVQKISPGKLQGCEVDFFALSCWAYSNQNFKIAPHNNLIPHQNFPSFACGPWRGTTCCWYSCPPLTCGAVWLGRWPVLGFVIGTSIFEYEFEIGYENNFSDSSSHALNYPCSKSLRYWWEDSTKVTCLKLEKSNLTSISYL